MSYLAYRLKSITEVRLGTWRQELKQSLQRNAAYCLTYHDLLNYLSFTAQTTCPGKTLITVGPPTSISNQKMPYWHVHGSI